MNSTPKQETRFLKNFSAFASSINCLEHTLTSSLNAMCSMERILSQEPSLDAEAAARIFSVLGPIFKINQNIRTSQLAIESVLCRVLNEYSSSATRSQRKTG